MPRKVHKSLQTVFVFSARANGVWPARLVGKGSGHAQTTRDMAEKQPDGNKHPRGTPTW